jgi:alkanesulfonate monooxygenase SsuD/methylene tetrahydromethanopterin reductase-like flavin-dependent oxidoreductase (luciferase family)
VYPPPVSGELPLWLTSSGEVETFQTAGTNSTGVLTHLMNQNLRELAAKIAFYRETLRSAGSDWRGHVTLMVHTFISTDTQTAAQQARPAPERYLISAMRAFTADRSDASPQEERKAKLAVRAACDRYLETDGLFGSVESVLDTVLKFAEAGIGELACLIDFGLPTDTVLGGLERLGEVRRRL